MPVSAFCEIKNGKVSPCNSRCLHLRIENVVANCVLIGFFPLQLSLTGGVFSIDGTRGRIETVSESLPDSYEEKEKVFQQIFNENSHI